MMIICASRRTDIPAFFPTWFMNRIEAGYCTVVNPFNSKQVSYVSLLPGDVDVIVFWTKNAAPILKSLQKLDSRGYRYYFQYTVNDYPVSFEPNLPVLPQRIDDFKQLSTKLGYEKVIWRYDPIIVSNQTPYEYHLSKFAKIAEEIQGFTKRAVISIVDEYRKATYNFRKLQKQGIYLDTNYALPGFGEMIKKMAAIARNNGMEIFSCAERIDLSGFDVLPNKCVDDNYIKKVFNLDIAKRKDKYQRPECGCVESKDIGFYDTCLHGCCYCYAGSYSSGSNNHKKHKPESPSLLGYYDVNS